MKRTLLQQLQAERVAEATKEIRQLLPEALRRWEALQPSVRLRKLDSLRRLLAVAVRRGAG